MKTEKGERQRRMAARRYGTADVKLWEGVGTPVCLVINVWVW